MCLLRCSVFLPKGRGVVPRWLWFAPLAGVLMAVAVLAFRQGLTVAQITETDVIETYTAHYVALHGQKARATDCSGRPSAQKGVWIIVTCQSATGQRFDFPIDRFGRLLLLDGKKEDLHAPRT